jgi:hypothetical protein
MSKENPYEKELPSIVEPGEGGTTGDKPAGPLASVSGAEYHLATGNYINQLSSEFGDKSNGAHVAANAHLNKAASSMMASIRAHGEGDYDAALNHFHSAVLRVEAADEVGNAETPELLSGKQNTARVAFNEYKRMYGRQR